MYCLYKKIIMLHLVPFISLKEMGHNSPCRKCAQCLLMNRNIFLYTLWSVSCAGTKIYAGVWDCNMMVTLQLGMRVNCCLGYGLQFQIS